MNVNDLNINKHIVAKQKSGFSDDIAKIVSDARNAMNSLSCIAM